MVSDTGPDREQQGEPENARASDQENGEVAARGAGQAPEPGPGQAPEPGPGQAVPGAGQPAGQAGAPRAGQGPPQPAGPGAGKPPEQDEALERKVFSRLWPTVASVFRSAKLVVIVAALFVAVCFVKVFRSPKLLAVAVSLFVIVCLVVVVFVVVHPGGEDSGIPGNEYRPLPTQPDPGPSAYGAGANPSGNPVGGGDGYNHYYSPTDNQAVTVTTPSELSRALQEAEPGDIVWVPDGATITITRDFGEVVKSGVVLASNRGQDGAAGGRIKWTYTKGEGMTPLLVLESRATVSGLRLEGPIATAGLDSANGGSCIALRGMNGATNIEVENCEISKFAWGGIYFNDGNLTEETRHWVHHCYIHSCQRHGFGYGIAEEGSAAYLAECNIFRENRHHVMAQAAEANPNSYEVRYNIFYEAVYASNGNPNGTWYYSHQVDCHGGADSPGCYAGNVLKIHHNTFYENPGKPNVCIRGVPMTGCDVGWNWTVKGGTDAGQGPNGQQWEQLVDAVSYQKMTVHDNWYGTDPPPAP